MGKRINIPLTLTGEWTTGDAGSVPDGYARALENMFVRPGRVAARPPFVYDNLTTISGLANHDDSTNQVSRLVALSTTQAVYEKATSGETWGSTIGTAGGIRLTDWANYKGTIFGMMADASDLPAAAWSYDGTTFDTSPFNSAIQARCVTTFNERLLLLYPRGTVTNTLFSDGGVERAYGTSPDVVNVTALKITNADTTILNTLTPTSTAASACFSIIATDSYDSTVDFPILWSCSLRNRNPGIAVPITLLAVVGGGIGRARAYPLNALAVNVAPSGYIDGTMPLYKVTTAGTTAGGAPAFNLTVGSTTTDGTVVWTCIAPTSILGKVETNLDGDTAAEWQTLFVPATYPGSAGVSADNTSLSIAWVLQFFNSTNTALAASQIVPIDIGYRDRLADGNPAKKNYGQQVTLGDFYYPFFNQESSATATVDLDDVVWSEIADPKAIRAANNYTLAKTVGYGTAATVISARYLAFKRDAFWQFQGTTDPDNPIRLERLVTVAGCLGPRAIDTWNDEVFFISEYAPMRYRVGDDAPRDFAGEGMRETIMSNATWVEDNDQHPLLAIDKDKLIVWVYTQTGTLYAFDLRTEKWSTHYSLRQLLSPGHPVVRVSVDAMAWNQNTNNFYVSFIGRGLTVMDYDTTAYDTTVSGGDYPGTMRVDFRPIQLMSPGRFDATLERVRLLYNIEDGIAEDDEIAAQYLVHPGGSFAFPDQEFTQTAPGTAGFENLTLPARLTAPSVSIRVERNGYLGEASWALSTRAWAEVNVRRGEFPTILPTPT